MAEVELSKALKDLPNRVLTVPLEERGILFQNVVNVLPNPGINSTIVRGICKVMATTITKYKDNFSQKLVKNLLSALLIKHHDLAIEHMVSVFKNIVLKELPNVSSNKGAKIGLIALEWSILIMKEAQVDSNVFKTEKERLLEYQCVFYQSVLYTSNNLMRQTAESLFCELWSLKNFFDQYKSNLIASETSTIPRLLVTMLLIEYDKSTMNSCIIETHKSCLVNMFIQTVVSSKLKLCPKLIQRCQPLLNTISEEEFSSKLYPPLHRAMLRNPEIIISGLGLIFQEINLDFSAYGTILGKILIHHLYSKEEISRTESVEALKQLSLKCGKFETIQNLLECIFSVLGGSEGKITIIEYRLNLLQGAGYLSFNNVNGQDKNKLFATVVELFSKVLESEIQEKVLCHALEMFSLWSVKFDEQLSTKVINLYQKGMEMKTTTGAVRLSYLHWLLMSLQKSTLPENTNLVPQLLLIFDNAFQNPSQIHLIAEAACASCILFKVQSTNHNNINLESFYGTVTDLSKHSFFGDKFVSTASPETLCHIFILAEKLLTLKKDDLKGSQDQIFKAIIHCLLSSHAKVKIITKQLLPNILNDEKGVSYVKCALKELKNFIQANKLDTTRDTMVDEGQKNNFVVAIENLCDFEEITCSNAQSLALDILFICSYPNVYQNAPNLWETILKNKFNLDPKVFISLNIKDIKEHIIEDYKLQKTYEHVVTTIVKLCPDIVLPELLKKIQQKLVNPEITNITDIEYFTFLTPDGEIYDKSILPNNDDLYTTVGLKRENKVYSYKEQIEELQLRRELDEKRRMEGKIKPPKLTPKQEEALKNQFEKERIIKMRLQNIQNSVLEAISMLESAFAGDSALGSLYFCKLLPTILKNLRSPLVAEKLTEVYYNLSSSCFTGILKDLGHNITVFAIRLEKPHCDLKEEWTNMNLQEGIINTLSMLGNYNDDLRNCNDEISDHVNIMSIAAFSCVFEFLKRAFYEPHITTNHDALISGIHFIEIHAQIYFKTQTNIKFLPRQELLQYLLKFISNYPGRVRSQSMTALLEVAKLSSGEKHSAIAEPEEITLLIDSLLDKNEVTRDAALRSLLKMISSLKFYRDLDKNLSHYINRIIWITKFDVSPENSDLANEIWDILEYPLPNVDDVLSEILNKEVCIQKASAKSLVPLIEKDLGLIKSVMHNLIEIYTDKLNKIPAKLDQFDREIEPAIDQWQPRRGVAIAIMELSPYFNFEEVNFVMEFMVSHGLGDTEEIVHKEMLASALAIVDKHGKDNIVTLIPVFEDFLDKAPKSENYDNIRQAVVILMGSVARHLEKDDKRIEPIVRRLLTALTTPSQQVQEAVANCLPHLMPAVKDEAPALVKKLLQQLIKSDKYGERRGAAYGIAGIVKGLGILSLKQLDIMSKLTTYIQEKKNYKSREGALFAFEILCTNLGRLFEPYIVHVLPYLLQCFGDSSVYVRQAADETARVVMRKLSAHGVKLILPSLLEALDEDSWRTKTASVELLGAMAFCAPKQLSSCLPSIVPKLIEVLGDSHTKVQEAGAEALKVIGSVIKNPEIQAIVPVLLSALEDPSKNTSTCLNCLLQTKFVHFIDAPSLALIMPVVQRAFMDRSTETRKMAAQIIGNMYSLTDQKDLTPYLPNIIPGLKTSLLDPVPEVRAVSARALGAMVRGMGESSFEDLLPWLMQTLTSEASSVDRSGAAQGLSEVVGGLGVEKLHKLMPEIIATAERNDIAPHVKDGYIMMFIYMPGAFPQEFTPYIGQIINPILRALADENEYVRDTALKAGQRIVNLYAESAVTLLLPELEKGLFDDNWRIRYSSVQLLGDLLYRISGVSGKMTTETASEDDNFGTEQSHTAIIRFLGVDRRNRVLSGLYMGRSDVSLMVRQAALHVWKVVVTNTPRTLREILPTLFSLLLGCLASTSYDKRQVAARTLGDLVRKLGERVLPEIIPILERGLDSEQADQRQGVCIGLSEIMASTSKEMVFAFVNSLVPTVRKALCDPLPEVREAAAKTFESLHSTVGSRALDDILPAMLERLSDSDENVAENTLDGLRQVMSIKPKVVLPYLIPQLTSYPVNTKALSILVSVAGDALTKYLPRILASLLQALSDSQGSANEQQELEYCQTVILSVTDETGIRTIMDTLLASAKSDNIETKKSVSSLLCAFCVHSPGDYSQYVPQLLRSLLRLMAETDKDILQRSWDALSAVIRNLDSTQQIAHVSDVRQAVRFAASDLNGSELPGFCLPKGISPLLPVFREAILNGLPDEKENAAQGLGEVISLTNAQSLQPSVVHITGPLIRILGDRFNAGVKAAVLETLAILLQKVGVMLKQFLPQLQTTFLKSLNDPNRNVRMKAGFALSELVKIHSRADPLFNEIHNGVKTADDSGIRETMVHALRSLITPSGDKMSEPIRKQIYATLLGMLGHHEEITRNCVGGCLGAITKYLSEEQIDDLFLNHLLVNDCDEGHLKHGRTVAIYVALKECPSFILKSNLEEKIITQITMITTSDKVPIACNGIRAITYFFEHKLLMGITIPPTVTNAFSRAMNHSSNDVKQIVAKSCSHLAKSISAEKIPLELMRYLVPMLVNGTKEKNGYVKSNSELALISLLRLRENDTEYKKVCQILEPGACDSLTEVVSKILRKLVAHTPGKEDQLDDSLLT